MAKAKPKKKEKKDEKPAAPLKGPAVIRKFRYNRVSLTIEWEEDGDDYAVTFHDNPKPSLLKAFHALAPVARALGEFPEKDDKNITVLGFTLTPKGDNVLAVIVAYKKLKDGECVMNFSTPIRAMYADHENKKAAHIDKADAKLIEDLISEVQDYLDGDRADGKIEGSSKPSAKKKEDAKQVKFPGMEEPSAPPAGEPETQG